MDKGEYITEDFVKLANRKSITKLYNEDFFSVIRYGKTIGIERWYNLPARTLKLICKEVKRIYGVKPVL